jgi:hypothetical protein
MGHADHVIPAGIADSRTSQAGLNAFIHMLPD